MTGATLPGLWLGGLGAHMVGDYVLQSNWMARLKTSRWLPAGVHGAINSAVLWAVAR